MGVDAESRSQLAAPNSANYVQTELSQQSNAPWYVAHTKSSQEHVAEANLARQGYQVYLPQLKILKNRRRANEISQSVLLEPMFPRYLFFKPAHVEHSIAPVRSSIGVAKLVQFGLEPARLSVDALKKIQAVESLQHDSSLEELSGLSLGKKVIVSSGPLAGLNGLVSGISKERVMVLMELLGREAKVSFKLAELMLAS